MGDGIVTWGTCKGVRGYWEWHRGHAKFVRADEAPKAAGIQIIQDIQPYQNIAMDGGIIGSRRQHRDMLRAHNLVEVGNEKPRMHPRDVANQNRQKRDPKIIEALKQASRGKWL